MDTEVLIVGAGPTGLMLANQLRRRGVCAIIIDRNSGPAPQTRAVGVQARSLEIFAKLGIADQALALGKRGTGANMWANGRRIARIPLGDIGRRVSPYPFVLILGQDDNERLLRDRLRDWGTNVQWCAELVGLEQGSDCVTATLRLEGGAMRKVTAAYVAGCDGSHSVVRELSGIPFPGQPYEQVFFIADTETCGDMTPDEINVYLWKKGFHLFFPMRGVDRWRIIGILPPALRDRDGLSFADVSPHVHQEAGARLAFKACNWFSTYRIHHRCATRFRDRRCFLLGDAAHIHSPMGAQGMNTGLQDAYNLGWKLACVVKGQAEMALLDSYESERIPVARRLLRTTDRAFMLVVSDSWLASLFRTQVLARIVAFAMGSEWIQRFAFRTISQTGIHYRSSRSPQTLTGLPEDAPRAGDRFPWLQLESEANGPTQDLFQTLDDTRFNLILIGQPAPPECGLKFGDLLRTHVIPDLSTNRHELARVGIPALAFYLETWGGFVFINLDPDARPLREAMGSFCDISAPYRATGLPARFQDPCRIQQ